MTALVAFTSGTQAESSAEDEPCSHCPARSACKAGVSRVLQSFQRMLSSLHHAIYSLQLVALNLLGWITGVVQKNPGAEDETQVYVVAHASFPFLIDAGSHSWQLHSLPRSAATG
jgi:hypothetical protein